jgi:hypothetical protein
LALRGPAPLLETDGPRSALSGSRQAQADLYHEDFEDRSVLAILHGAGGDIMPSTRENFVIWTASFRLTPVLDRTLVSPAGTTIFEVYWLDGAGHRRYRSVKGVGWMLRIKG